jgi:hypothetical protein
MSITDGLLIASTLLGPILAVQAQKWLERLREQRNAQRRIFYALMSTRATPVASEHVQALNMIVLEFGGRLFWRPTARDKNVVDKWRIYADHLNHPAPPSDEAAQIAWRAATDDLLVNLLEAMSQALDYSFDRVELKRGVYYPQAHAEADLRKIRFETALVRILTGEASLPMAVTSFPVSEEALNLQKKVQEGLVGAFAPDGAIKVHLSGPEQVRNRKAAE